MRGDTLIALAIVAAAAVFLIVRVVRARRAPKGGCDNCGH
jgi:hypothetical protein